METGNLHLTFDDSSSLEEFNWKQLTHTHLYTYITHGAQSTHSYTHIQYTKDENAPLTSTGCLRYANYSTYKKKKKEPYRKTKQLIETHTKYFLGIVHLRTSYAYDS